MWSCLNQSLPFNPDKNRDNQLCILTQMFDNINEPTLIDHEINGNVLADKTHYVDEHKPVLIFLN